MTYYASNSQWAGLPTARPGPRWAMPGTAYRLQCCAMPGMAHKRGTGLGWGFLARGLGPAWPIRVCIGMTRGPDMARLACQLDPLEMGCDKA